MEMIDSTPYTVIPHYRLLTAEITYRLPDHPHLLQVYFWQDYDVAPDYPHLRDFLAFWEANLEGRLHSVVVGTTNLFEKHDLFYASGHFSIH